MNMIITLVAQLFLFASSSCYKNIRHRSKRVSANQKERKERDLTNLYTMTSRYLYFQFYLTSIVAILFDLVKIAYNYEES